MIFSPSTGARSPFKTPEREGSKGKTTPVTVPPPDSKMFGEQKLLVVDGGESKLPDAMVSQTYGPARDTDPNEPVSELGGPVTDMYTQVKDAAWEGNFYNQGTRENLQGGPVPETGMNTRKIMWAFPRDEDGKLKSTNGTKKFRVFILFDFLFWSEPAENPYGCFAISASAPHVEHSIKYPFFKQPMTVLYPGLLRRREYPWLIGIAAISLALLAFVCSRGDPRRALIAGGAALLATLTGTLIAWVVTHIGFSSVKFCGFFDSPSCWTGLPEDTRYEDAQDASIYKWKSNAIRTFGGAPEIGASWGYQYRNRLLQYLLANNFAVIVPGFSNVKYATYKDPEKVGALLPFRFDCQDWYFPPGLVESTDPSENYMSQNNGCAGGWPGPDAAMLASLMHHIEEGDFFGLKDTGYSLDMTRVALAGYSAGAQFVSRCINEFPVMKYVNPSRPKELKNFPNIRAAFMISGGVYDCYTGAAYRDWKGSNPRCAEERKGCLIDPSGNMTQETLAPLIGCCPDNTIETRYMPGGGLNVLDHPPVFLAQTENDSDADNTAHLVYASSLRNLLEKSHVGAVKIQQGVRTTETCWTPERCNGRPIAPPRQASVSLDKCSAHTWFPELIVPVAEFLCSMTQGDEPFTFRSPT